VFDSNKTNIIKIFLDCYNWCSLGFRLNCKWISRKCCQCALCISCQHKRCGVTQFQYFSLPGVKKM